MDGTREIIASRGNYTLLSTNLPFGTYRVFIKRYMIRTLAHRRWPLLVDTNEFFDYPGSEKSTLSEPVQYLDRHGYNTVNTIMPDMFSTEPISLWSSEGHRSFTPSICDSYDLADMSAKPLYEAIYQSNHVNNRALKWFKGGIRKRGLRNQLHTDQTHSRLAQQGESLFENH